MPESKQASAAESAEGMRLPDDEQDTTVDREPPESQDEKRFSPNNDITYALIYRAESVDSFDHVSDPHSVEAEVARSRGSAAVTNTQVPSPENSEQGPSPDPVKYNLEVEEGRLKTQTGFMFRFVDERYTKLSVFDVRGLDSLQDYPCPPTLIDALPARIRGRLQTQGYVKVQGVYNQERSRFYGTRLGWEQRNVDPWDRIMELCNLFDGSATLAVDYAHVKEGPDRWDIEAVAESRQVTEETLRNHIRQVENALDD